MKGKTIFASVILQLVILLYLMGEAFYPLLAGVEVRLKVAPPERLCNYSALLDNFSRLRLSQLQPEPRHVRRGERVYVVLKAQGGFWEVDYASFEKPRSGVFIVGRSRHWVGWFPSYYNEGPTILLTYGIDWFYASRKQAWQIEKTADYCSRRVSAVKVMVAPNGMAAFKSFEVE